MINQLILWLSILTLLSSCNSLFYYPDRVTYLTPDKRGFAYEESKLETPDGESLNYWVIAPKSEKVGTILHFHGNAQNISTHFLFVAWFSSFGYEVISFDYRGYGQSSGVPNREGLFVDGKAMLDLLESKNLPYFVIAQSLGGAVAIPAIAASAPENLKGLILDSTFASYRGIARDKLAEHPITWALQWPLSFLVSDELSPVEYVKGLRIPVLQFHSKYDQVVPYKQGKQLFAAFSKDRQFVTLTRKGHTAAFTPPFEKHHDDLLAWLCRYSGIQERCMQVVQERKRIEKESKTN
ncbi:MAG: alpha/beta hydrolase [Oligoflexales bacterium]|nr:alpha/beta hydrolase [Oligoflexales bacterium]